MTKETNYDLYEIAMRLDDTLRESQQGLEKAITDYQKAADHYADVLTNYRKSRGELTVELKQKYPATIVGDIVKGETAELKGEVEKARLYVKLFEFWMNAYESRINSTKFVGNRIKKATGEI